VHVAGRDPSVVDANGDPLDADLAPGTTYYTGGIPNATIDEAMMLPPSFTSPQGLRATSLDFVFVCLFVCLFSCSVLIVCLFYSLRFFGDLRDCAMCIFL
jgi:hypothetical protein